MVYWSGSPDHWNAIRELQKAKREYTNVTGIEAIHSDQYVMTNPVTGRDVPIADLKYAAEHLAQIYESGQIREDRWAFLWYH